MGAAIVVAIPARGLCFAAQRLRAQRCCFVVGSSHPLARFSINSCALRLYVWQLKVGFVLPAASASHAH
eukprot:4139831-Alexandrium_andersonii.AAC.1